MLIKNKVHYVFCNTLWNLFFKLRWTNVILKTSHRSLQIVGEDGKYLRNRFCTLNFKDRYKINTTCNRMSHKQNKTIELLVPVSFMRYRTSTPGLSTWWSSTALIGKSSFKVGFPLRCIQRLSRPYLATQLCRWRDNWPTRGMSTSVLSYWRQILSNFLHPRQIGTELSHDVLNPAHVPL